MSDHPYRTLPDHAFWRKAVADVAPGDVDPVVAAPFKLARTHRVATAGSCFAQHIARHLGAAGAPCMVTETAHPLARDDGARYNYGVFTARYGNIYTSRQLLQLFRRVYGQFKPDEDVWKDADGHLVDPFRPQIQPGGFLTMEEYRADRARHFAAVREAFEGLDVLVFTLGLTECWTARSDGAAYPLCPGVAGGSFDPHRYRFVNLSAKAVADDMVEFIEALRGVNAKARVILTVSPVPLIATAEPSHVLVSTVSSKSRLRVATESIVRRCKNVAYFPSYEIVTGAFTRGAYFAPDLRSVTEEGVGHVMRVFLRHFLDVAPAPAARPAPVAQDQHLARMARLAQATCDEEALEREA